LWASHPLNIVPGLVTITDVTDPHTSAVTQVITTAPDTVLPRPGPLRHITSASPHSISFCVCCRGCVDMLPILSSSYYPPFPHTSDGREWQRHRQRTHSGPLHSIACCSVRVRLSAVPLRGPPWPAVVRRPPWPAARRVLPCMYYCVVTGISLVSKNAGKKARQAKLSYNVQLNKSMWASAPANASDTTF
jgi:hypothetical protein